jgi:hypothetical protein
MVAHLAWRPSSTQVLNLLRLEWATGMFGQYRPLLNKGTPGGGGALRVINLGGATRG